MLYLAQIGPSDPQIGLLLTLTLAGDAAISMDVPTRQAHTMAVVDPDERAAASGIAGVARTAGAAISPSLAGVLLAVPALISVPFFLAGGLKVIYDVLLWRSFRAVGPPDQPAVNDARRASQRTR